MPPIPDIESTSPVTEKELEEKYRKILKDNSIHHEISKVSMKDAGLKGEGFASQTHLVTINFKDPSLSPLNLFVKTETENESHSKFLEETRLFEKESTFFMEYLKEARDFCRDKGMEELVNIYPKCYYGDKKLIVLENLVLDKEFFLMDRVERQDMEPAKMALETLAKHHAISYAFMKHLGGPPNFFKKFEGLDFEPFDNPFCKQMMSPSIENGIKTCLEILKRSNPEGKEEAMALLQSRAGKAWDYVLEIIRFNPEDPIHVLNHGDYHNNNMMFHRNKSGKLDQHMAIDLQAVRYDSPATDLSYFLYSSVKPEVRRANLKNLLTHYLDLFNETTEKLGYPSNLTYDQLLDTYLRKFNFGVWFVGLLVSTKGSYLALKDVDISKIDMTDFGRVLSEKIREWIEKNPELCEEDGKTIADLMMEYTALINQ